MKPKIEFQKGDIARQVDLDCVVNAANAELAIGGGVAGAIHRAAGSELYEACRPLAPIKPGQAVITPAFNLPNKYVIHCLGPVYGVDEPAHELLSSCYTNALNLARKHKIFSIGFPAISTGAFGYPVKEGAEIAFNAINEFDYGSNPKPGLIRFVLFSDEDLSVFKSL